jgi:hypothetical protein
MCGSAHGHALGGGAGSSFSHALVLVALGISENLIIALALFKAKVNTKRSGQTEYFPEDEQ